MRVLAIDHGNARAGVAVCDPTETITRPLEAVEPPEPAAVARVAEEHGAELIVVDGANHFLWYGRWADILGRLIRST